MEDLIWDSRSSIEKFGEMIAYCRLQIDHPIWDEARRIDVDAERHDAFKFIDGFLEVVPISADVNIFRFQHGLPVADTNRSCRWTSGGFHVNLFKSPKLDVDLKCKDVWLKIENADWVEVSKDAPMNEEDIWISDGLKPLMTHLTFADRDCDLDSDSGFHNYDLSYTYIGMLLMDYCRQAEPPKFLKGASHRHVIWGLGDGATVLGTMLENGFETRQVP